MTIDLPPELEQFIAESVRNGDFPAAEDVIRESLRQLRKQQDRKREELRTLLAEGIAEDDRGESEPMDAMEILAEVRAEQSAADQGAA